MFACVSCTAIFASSMNIVDELGVLRDVGRMRLIARIFSKPSTPISLRLEDLGHAADVDAVEQEVLAEAEGLEGHSGALRGVVLEPSDVTARK